MDLIIAYGIMRSQANSTGHDDMPNQSLPPTLVTG